MSTIADLAWFASQSPRIALWIACGWIWEIPRWMGLADSWDDGSPTDAYWIAQKRLLDTLNHFCRCAGLSWRPVHGWRRGLRELRTMFQQAAAWERHVRRMQTWARQDLGIEITEAEVAALSMLEHDEIVAYLETLIDSKHSAPTA